MGYFLKFKKTFNFQFSTFNSQAGQAILIIVLVMVIGLTVGLALISRTVTNVRTSTEEENSQRAFSAAEAGIEQALKEQACTPSAEQTCVSKIGSDTDMGNFSNFNVSISAKSASQILLNGGNSIPQDDGVDLWLITHNADGSPDYTKYWDKSNDQKGKLVIHWGSQSDPCNDAALEIIVVTQPLSAPKTKRFTFDQCTSGARGTNGFTAGDNGNGVLIEGKEFKYKTSVPIDLTGGFLVRIIPLYKSTPMGVLLNGTGTLGSFPPQGKKIEATGKSGNTERKIIYFQGYPSLPIEFFPYIIFAP